jgi:hypothetical protein
MQAFSYSKSKLWREVTLFIAMPVFIKDSKYFLFVHVPKTAGTSLEVVFARSGFIPTYVDVGTTGSLNHLRHCSPQHMHAEVLQTQFLFDRFNGIFMIVRNPYDRFRSEYCMAHAANIDTSASKVELWANKVFSDYTSDNYTRDNHIRPQHEFYIPGAVVYKYEQGFIRIIEEICDRYGINLIRDDVRERARVRDGGIQSSDIQLNRTVVSMINEHYAKDFELFNYKMEG